jgi:hypothetical protein
MRTTVSIEDSLLTAAKQRALERKTTLSGVVEDALRLALSSEPDGEETERIELPVSRRTGGTRPGIDVSAGSRLRDLMDDA